MMKSISTWKQELTKGAHAARLAALSDAGMIETYGGEYLEGAADACEKLLKK